MAVVPTMSVRPFCIAVSAAVGLLGVPSALAAPPQILALVATGEPTPLACTDGACGAEFTTFCLQSFRDSPRWGSAYKPADGSDLRLVVTDFAGATREMDAVPHVMVDSERTYVSVRISVPETLLAELSATRLALAVGTNASLVPETFGDPDDPITTEEAADTTGPVRERAERIYNEDADAVLVARTAQQLENARQQDPAAELDSLWEALGGRPSPASPEALRTLARNLQSCMADGRSMAFCIQSMHETTIAGSNRRVWQGLGAGM